MQRKPSKKTRGVNADEKRFMSWVKEQPCIQCCIEGVVVEHMYGSTFRHNRVLVGMWALIPLCQMCDNVKTQGSHRAYLDAFGETQAQSFKRLLHDCPVELLPPHEVQLAIMDWNR